MGFKRRKVLVLWKNMLTIDRDRQCERMGWEMMYGLVKEMDFLV